jgi:hypothetical protein
MNATQTQNATDIQVIAPTPRVDLLAEARKGAASGSMIGESSERHYAEMANKLLGVEKWYVFNHDDITDEGKIVNGEWKLLKAEYDAAYMAKRGTKYPNFSVVKGRIRKYAETDAKERGLFGEVPDVAEVNEDGTPKGKAKHNKSVDERIMESTALYMFLKRQEGLNTKQSKFLTYLANGLTEFGVNLAMIESSKK